MLPLFLKLGGLLSSALPVAKRILKMHVPMWVVVSALLTGFAGRQFYLHRHVQRGEVPSGWTKTINDSTKAVIASPAAGKKDLPALTDAAKSLKGKLIAGVIIKTTPETVYVDRGVIPSTVLGDSTRVAERSDTTKGGYIIKVNAEAPPFPANLKLGYTFIVPEFHPSIGYIQIGRNYAAVVSWAGHIFQIDSAFYLPPETPTWELHATGGLIYSRPSKQFESPVMSLNLDRSLGANYTVTLSGYASLPGDHGFAVYVSRSLWSR